MIQMIKLVAVDMDGTLLNPLGQITPETVQAIKKMQYLGVEFLINSGRNFFDVQSILARHRISCNYICMNGAAAYTSDGELIASIPLPSLLLVKILKTFKDLGLYHNIHTDKGIYTTHSKEQMRIHFINDVCSAFEKAGQSAKNFKERIDYLLSAINYANSIQELLNSDLTFYKVSTVSPDAEVLHNAKNKLTAIKEIEVTSSLPTNIEITHCNANKGLMLKTYANKYHIPLDQVMAIGDSQNDYSMLSMDFGYTVAMANADDNIKKAAKYITKSNEKDGVAHAIQTFIFNA